MFQFFKIFLKNLRITLKSKFSLILILIGPLALISFFSFGIVGSGISTIDASFYSEETGQIRSGFIEILKSNSFIITETTTREECIDQVREGKTNICITLDENEEGLPLPRDLSSKNIKDLETGKGINLYVDFSKQRIVWGIINKVQIVVDLMSDRIQQEIITELSRKFDSSLNQINVLKSNIELLKNQVSTSQDRITQVMTNLDNFKAISTSTIDSVIASLNSISVSFPGLVIPQVTSAITSLNNLKLQISSNSLDSKSLDSNSLTLVQDGINQFKQNLDLIDGHTSIIQNEISVLKDSFSENGKLNANKFVEPIPLSYSSVEDEDLQKRTGDLNLVDYLLPSIISFFLVFTSITLGSTLVIKERSSNAYIRNYLSKTSKIQFIIGNLLYLIVLILAQITIILIFSNYIINPLVSDNWESLAIYLVLGISVFSTLGMCLGYLFNSRDSVILAAVCISLIFIIFSPLINPIETMPPILREIFSKSPAILVENGVSKAILFNKGINGEFIPILQLSGIFIMGFLICLMFHYLSREKIVKE